MVDITRIVEKVIKEQKGGGSIAPKPKLQKNHQEPVEKTVLDNLFGEKKQDDPAEGINNIGFSKKLGDLFGVDEENDG